MTALSTHLCHLFLERKCESSASVREGPCSVGHVLEPLDDEGCRDTKWEIPYDVEVRWICGATHILFTNVYIQSDHNKGL